MHPEGSHLRLLSCYVLCLYKADQTNSVCYSLGIASILKQMQVRLPQSMATPIYDVMVKLN